MPSIPCFLAPAATLYLLVSKLCSSELLCSSSPIARSQPVSVLLPPAKAARPSAPAVDSAYVLSSSTSSLCSSLPRSGPAYFNTFLQPSELHLVVVLLFQRRIPLPHRSSTGALVVAELLARRDIIVVFSPAALDPQLLLVVVLDNPQPLLRPRRTRAPHTRQAVVLGVFSPCGLTGSSRFIGLSRVRAGMVRIYV